MLTLDHDEAIDQREQPPMELAASDSIAVSFQPSRELYPFESHWFHSPVGRMHYVDEGRGPPILFCHGNPTWSFLYRNVILSLRNQFRCVAIDYPGFGLSDRPMRFGYTPQEQTRVVVQLVNRLDLRNLVIVGHDWGGPIGVATALSDPDRIRGLAFGNTWFWPPAYSRMNLFSRFMSTSYMQKAILERNFFVEKLIPAQVVRTLSPLEMDHYRGVQATPEMRRGVAEFPRQINVARPWLAALARGAERELARKPLLLTWGMRDIGAPPKYMRKWRRVFPDHRVVELPQAKHFIHEDASPEIARSIAERFG
jgi:haloalkane dehalogenase